MVLVEQVGRLLTDAFENDRAARMPLDIMSHVVYVEVYGHPRVVRLVVLGQLFKGNTVRELLYVFDFIGVMSDLVLGMNEELYLAASGLELAVVLDDAPCNPTS